MKKYLFAAAVLAAVAAPAAQAKTLQQMRNEFVSACAQSATANGSSLSQQMAAPSAPAPSMKPANNTAPAGKPHWMPTTAPATISSLKAVCAATPKCASTATSAAAKRHTGSLPFRRLPNFYP